MVRTDVEIWLEERLLMTCPVFAGGDVTSESSARREALLAAIEDEVLTRETAARARLVCRTTVANGA
jgi:hypothetical protein